MRLFNTGDYHRCHDAFEDIWVESGGDQKVYYQGLIQTAVAYHKIRTRVFSGAKALFERGMEKLERTRHLVTPVRTDLFLHAARENYQKMLDLGEAGLDRFDESTFPQIHYIEGYEPQPPPDPSWLDRHVRH